MKGEAGGLAFELHGEAAGHPNRPPLVLIHGAGGDRHFWPPALRRLPWAKVYAVDLPGHGGSPGEARASISGYARAVAGWMDALGLDRAVFAGHSMGGAIAMQLAGDHAPRTAGLVLVGTGARLRVHPDLLGLVDDQEKREEAVDWILRWSFGPGVDPALLRLARRRLLGGNAAALQADFHACNAFDLMGRIGDLSVPALVLCGEEDKMTPPKYSRYLAGHLPDAELVLIPGAGHMVMLEAPEAVARAILDFLARRFSVPVER